MTRALLCTLLSAVVIVLIAGILAGCTRPPERTLWREMLEHGEL